jgi:hypothetical protein
MISSASQAAPLSRGRLSRDSALIRAISTHDGWLACLVAFGTAALAFAPRIRAGGFLADDWANYAQFKFPLLAGHHTALAALASTAGSRVGGSLYWFGSFSLFGNHTRFYLLLAALLAVVLAFSVYLLLRELRFSIVQSLAITVLTIVAPSLETARFWFTPSGSQIEFALFFFGLTLALRAFSAAPPKRTRLHVASWLLYVASACYSDLALPLIAVCVLVYLARAQLATSVRRWAFDLIIVVVGYIADYTYVSSTEGFVKLPRSMWAEHARLLGDEALTLFTRMFGLSSEGARQPELIALAVLTAAGLFLWRSPRTRTDSRRDLQRWAYAFFVSLVAIVAAYSPYIPAMLYYEPLGGLNTHINIAIAAPLAVGVFAVLMLTRVVLTEFLDRLRPGLGGVAVALVAAWFAVIFVDGLRNVRSDARIWAVATGRDHAVLRLLTANLRSPVAGSTIYAFGEAGTVSELPVFFSSWELNSAVKVAYDREDISAYNVVVDDDTLECTPRGITVFTGKIPLNTPSPYGRSYFFNVPTGSSGRIDSLGACNAALSIYRPGPYAGTTLEWSR